MQRRWALSLAVLALALAPWGGPVASGAPSHTSGGNLIISSFGGSWGQAIQVGMIDAFEQKTGIHVTLLPTQDLAKSEAAIKAGRAPIEDIIDGDAPTDVVLDRLGLLGHFNYGQFNRAAISRLPAAAKLPYALGWGEFAIGLCFDKTKFPDGKPQPATWADFWNFQKFPGKRGMLDWPDEPQPEFGLIAAGVPMRSVYPLNVDLAFSQLNKLRPHVPKFPSDPAVLAQMLVDKTVSMEACFTHRVQKLIDAGLPNIGISYRQARLEIETFSVWKHARNYANAIKFLNYVIQPRPQADWAQFGDTGPINPAAFRFMPAAIRAKLPTAPGHREVFTKNAAWYSALASNGKSNFENLVSRWTKTIGS